MKRWFLGSFFLLVFLSSCSVHTEVDETVVTDVIDTRLTIESSQLIETEASSSETEHVETIEESSYFQVIRSDSMYYCYIYDENQEAVRVEGPFPRQPRVIMVNSHLVKFTMAAGTNVHWGFFYDTKMDVFSKKFESIFDQSNGKVAYGKGEKVIIRDIFDKSKFYMEISSFKYDFSPSVIPITHVEFINDGDSVKVTYLTGPDYEQVSEVFALT